MLHLDSAPRYGSHWAGLDLDAFLAWAEDAHQRAAAGEADGLGPQELPPEEGGGVLMPSRSGPVLYGAVELMCGDLSVMAQSREFTVDLAPKVGRSLQGAIWPKDGAWRMRNETWESCELREDR